MAGGRSRNSIMAVVFQNLPALRYLYNNRLNLKPGLKGKITVKFAVDEFGNVLHCEVVESSIADGELEQRVVAKIRAWRFEKIDKLHIPLKIINCSAGSLSIRKNSTVVIENYCVRNVDFFKRVK
jgi:TonB family protein